MFTLAEINLMTIYNPGTRLGLIHELEEMKVYVTVDESEIRFLVDSTLKKLKAITDGEFYNLPLHMNKWGDYPW